MRKIFIIIIFFNIFASIANSQIKPLFRKDSIPIFYKDTIPVTQIPVVSIPETFFSLGAIGCGNYNVYFGNFGIFERGMLISSFNNGTGQNFSGGIVAEINLFIGFSLQLRMLLENKSGKMKSEYLLPIYNDRYAKTEHNLDVKLYYYSFDLMLKYNFISNLYIVTGASYGQPKVYKYQLTVKILSDEISYENDLMQKTFSENRIMNMVKKYSLRFGLGYDIPVISNSLFISPEVGYDHPLHNIVSDSEWKVKSLNIAIILRLKL
jgi:hypothetical protein